MTPRAPVVLSFSRKGGKLSCVTRPRVRLNPMKLMPWQIAEAKLAVAEADRRKVRVDKNTVAIMAAYLGNIVERQTEDEDAGAVARMAVLEAAPKHDPNRQGFMQYAKFHANSAAATAYRKGQSEYRGDQEKRKLWGKWTRDFVIAKNRQHDDLRELARFVNRVTGGKKTKYGPENYTVDDMIEFRDLAETGRSTLSLEAPMDEGEEEDSKTSLMDTLPGLYTSAEDVIENAERLAAISKAAKNLTEEQEAVREQQLRGLSTAEIADILGFSVARVRAIQKQISAILMGASGVMAHQSSPDSE